MSSITIVDLDLYVQLDVDRIDTDQEYRLDIYLTACIEEQGYLQPYRLDGILWRGAEFEFGFDKEPESYEIENGMDAVSEFLYSSKGIEFLRTAAKNAGYAFKKDGAVYKPGDLLSDVAFGPGGFKARMGL